MPDGSTKSKDKNHKVKLDYKYMPGFGNDFETEALPGALPQGMNSPQKCSYGLYAEQLSGTPFTAPRSRNERTWCYRIRPSVKHLGNLKKTSHPYWKTAPCINDEIISLGQYRWDPIPYDKKGNTFISGMRTITTTGDVNMQTGMASHVYLADKSMDKEFFYSADSELLIIPQEGDLILHTELGVMDIVPGDIALIPRGLVFSAKIDSDLCRGFVCENYGQKFILPNRGPIGANCLANPRDFKTPEARFEDIEEKCSITVKWCGSFHKSELDHSPLDIVAWHGNYAPWKYDLSTFAPVGAILFDHPDPSIYTVLTSPSGIEGTANIDFILFRDRWNVAENTFRPPWYHKNVMSELMGNIQGKYDAKPTGFVPGGISLHNMMLPHGPDSDAFEGASTTQLEPQKLKNTMSFMFESRFPQHLTEFAANKAPIQSDYADCWQQIKKKFNGTPEGNW